jgi:hypothetical protein
METRKRLTKALNCGHRTKLLEPPGEMGFLVLVSGIQLLHRLNRSIRKHRIHLLTFFKRLNNRV